MEYFGFPFAPPPPEQGGARDHRDFPYRTARHSRWRQASISRRSKRTRRAPSLRWGMPRWSQLSMVRRDRPKQLSGR